MQPLRAITLVVLGLLGLGGLAGGLAFLTDRTGGRLGMTVDELPAWPLLSDYLVPGIVLVLLFGLLPLLAAWLLVRRSPRGWSLTTAVGLLLVGWMVGQIGAIGLSFPALQVTLLVVGIVLTGLGIDGGASSAADESHRSEESYPHAEDEPRPGPADDGGGPDGGSRPGRPADRSDSLR